MTLLARLRDPRVHAVLACLLVFVPTLMLLADSEYLLINDLRPFQVGMPEGDLVVPVPDYLRRQDVGWPRKLWSNLIDPTSHEAWLYRPFPDLLEWTLSSACRGSPGVWHAVILGLRFVTTWLTWRLVRRLGASAAGAAVATMYVAFFPAIPEVLLTCAESWIAPALLLTLAGICDLERGQAAGTSRGAAAVASGSFVLLTLSKEAMAPLSVVLLLCLGGALRRRVSLRATAWILSVAALFTVHQCIRFALAAMEPYATGAGGDAGSELLVRMARGLGWAVGEILLATANALPTVATVAALVVLGAVALARSIRDRASSSWTSAALLGGLAVSIVLVAAAPYAAIRYLYPAGLLAAPLLGLGFDRVAGRALLDRARAAAYVLLALGLPLFGGAGVLAQAAALAASSRADWDMLRAVAHRFDEGRDVVIVDDGGPEERAHWIECELKHLGLTRAVPRTRTARFVFLRAGDPMPPVPGGAVVLPANPGPSPPASLTGATDATVLRFDARSEIWCHRELAAIRRRAVLANPWFRFPKDAGSTRFPGHAWEVVEVR